MLVAHVDCAGAGADICEYMEIDSMTIAWGDPWDLQSYPDDLKYTLKALKRFVRTSLKPDCGPAYEALKIHEVRIDLEEACDANELDLIAKFEKMSDGKLVCDRALPPPALPRLTTAVPWCAFPNSLVEHSSRAHPPTSRRTARSGASRRSKRKTRSSSRHTWKKSTKRRTSSKKRNGPPRKKHNGSSASSRAAWRPRPRDRRRAAAGNGASVGARDIAALCGVFWHPSRRAPPPRRPRSKVRSTA